MHKKTDEGKREELSSFLSEQLLNEATNTVNRRKEKYGRPYKNHKRIADLWNAYLRGIGRPVDPADVVAMMVLVKISRLQESNEHYDSWVDMAGYAAVAASIIGEENYNE